MAILCKMPKLRELVMHGARSTDAGLKEIASLKDLQVLDLSYQPITAAGLKELKDLPNLRIVLLKGTRIKAEEFVNFWGVPSLETVGFDVGMVSDEALRTLRQHDLLYLLSAETRGPNEQLKTVRVMRLWGFAPLPNRELEY